jgi:hypothetical protein
VLTSDTVGLATWVTPASGLPTGTTGQTLWHNGTAWIANSVLINDGTNIGVSGNINLSGATPTYKVTNLIAPTAAADAATKGYVDAAGGGSACAVNYGNLCLNDGGLSFAYNSKTLYIDAFPRSTYVIGALTYGAYESQYGLAWQHCERIGARLPTLAEWNAACTALGGPAGNGMTTFGGSIASRYEWTATPNVSYGYNAMIAGYGSCSNSLSDDVSAQSTNYWFRCIR